MPCVLWEHYFDNGFGDSIKALVDIRCLALKLPSRFFRGVPACYMSPRNPIREIVRGPKSMLLLVPLTASGAAIHHITLEK